MSSQDKIKYVSCFYCLKLITLIKTKTWNKNFVYLGGVYLGGHGYYMCYECSEIKMELIKNGYN